MPSLTLVGLPAKYLYRGPGKVILTAYKKKIPYSIEYKLRISYLINKFLIFFNLLASLLCPLILSKSTKAYFFGWEGF